MTSDELRQKFLRFFEQKGHAIAPSSSLVPENDASVLFTTAGMQQFKPYYLGLKDAQQDFGVASVASVQKCVRTSDIEEVGDERHLTFFEMLGNFSFGYKPGEPGSPEGGYWKQEAIKYAHEFITQELKLKIDFVTVFAGEDGIPADEEATKIWQKADPNLEIKKFGREDNFWGPTGKEGPCGPTTEIYVDGIEVWNIVFNEFYCGENGTLRPLETRGIDTGLGLERLAMVVQKAPTVFETDLFSGYLEVLPDSLAVRKKRILADHLRAIGFMVSDGVRPGNKGAGYVLRRLMRRILAEFELEKIKLGVDWVVKRYRPQYPELDGPIIREILENEWKQFMATLNLGKKELAKLDQITPQLAFMLYHTYGLPLEVIKDKFPELDQRALAKEFEKHQAVSRAGADKKFKGGLAGHGEKEIKYHTATHLLHQALREVLGESVSQKGSNITSERLRFDFSHPQKMTEEEKRRVEEIVNEKIKAALPVQSVILPRGEAEQTGALHFFGEKYDDQVSIYFIGDSLAGAYSKEFCGGPHVRNTAELGHFKIIKEEAVAAGIRRIKAVLAP